MSSFYLKFRGFSTCYVKEESQSPSDFNPSFETTFDLADCDFSFSFWIKLTSYLPYSVSIFSKGDYIFNSFSYAIRTEFNGLIYLWLRGNWPWIITNTPLLVNEWSHVVFAYKNNDICNVYINSILDASVDVSGYVIENNNDDFYIGRGRLEYFNDSLDDIRFYKNKVLSQSEIDYIYNSGYGRKMNGEEDGLVWGSNCDDGTGWTLKDIKGRQDANLFGPLPWEKGGIPLVEKTGRIVIYPGETVEIDRDTEFVFSGSDGEIAYVIIDNHTFIIGDVNGKFVWDIGGAQEKIFNSDVQNNEKYSMDSIRNVSVSWDGYI